MSKLDTFISKWMVARQVSGEKSNTDNNQLADRIARRLMPKCGREGTYHEQELAAIVTEELATTSLYQAGLVNELLSEHPHVSRNPGIYGGSFIVGGFRFKVTNLVTAFSLSLSSWSSISCPGPNLI